MALTYLDRAAWGADESLPRKGYVVPRSRFVGLVVHHTVIVMADYDHDGLTGDLDDICAYMRRLQTARPDLGLDVPYSFVVFAGATPDDAVVCEGRGFERTGAHTAGYNSTRWGVALGGDYTHEPPTAGQLEGVRWVGRQLADPAAAEATIGHRDTKATACPGDCAYPLLGEVQPPFTELAPPPPVPLPIDYGAFDMATAQTKLVPVGALGPNGEGWDEVVFDAPFTRIVSATPNGPFPPVDGYWPLPTSVSAQARGDRAIVTVLGGWPGSTVNVWLTVA